MGGWNHDREWEIDLVERLRRGGTLEALSLGQLVSGWSTPAYDGGWESAEEHSKHAIRTGAVYLNDEAIAARKAQREYQRKEMAKAIAANKEKREREEARRRKERIEADRVEAIEAVERAKAREIYEQTVIARKRLREEQDAEWRRAEAERHMRDDAIVAANRAEATAARDRYEAERRSRTAAQQEVIDAANAARQAIEAEADRLASRDQAAYWEAQKARRAQVYETLLAKAKAREAERAAKARTPHYGRFPLAEAQYVLAQKWGCGSCGHQATLKPFGGKYVMTCKACKRTVTCEHAVMMAQIKANKERGPAV